MAPIVSPVTMMGGQLIASGGYLAQTGAYKVHTFIASDTFQITSGVGDVEYLVVAGGGGGGAGIGGGGGAGGMQVGTLIGLRASSYTVTVGNGGNGAAAGSANSGTNGQNSVFASITSLGGGFGTGSAGATPGTGGSGGGRGSVGGGGGAGGTGTANQGYNGGSSFGTPNYGAGGGGGRSFTGANGTSSAGGQGANGLSSSISGVAQVYAGGGGGGISTSGSAGIGGTGGGGNAGAAGADSAGAAGTAYTGGGGGGASSAGGYPAGGAGGSGIVTVRYLSPGSGNDTYTKILLHFDAVNGSTTIADSNLGGSAHTWTFGGSGGYAASNYTMATIFGSILYCPGTAWVETADHADFNLGSGDFTIDCWFYRLGGDGTYRYLCGQANAAPTAATNSAYLVLSNTNVMQFVVSDGTTPVTVTGTTAFTAAGWHHVAGVRTGNTLKLFLDGVQEGGNVTFSGTVPNATSKYSVGRIGEYATLYFNGYIEEFRLSVGIARWTANFATPTLAYGN